MKSLLATLAITGIAFSAFANDDVYEAREDLMKSFGGAMKSLSQMASGDAEFDAAKVEENLATLHDGAMQIAEVFPEGTNEGDSEALAVIWEQPEEFEASIDKLVMASMVDPIPADAAELGPKMAELGGACKACHETFRLDKD